MFFSQWTRKNRKQVTAIVVSAANHSTDWVHAMQPFTYFFFGGKIPLCWRKKINHKIITATENKINQLNIYFSAKKHLNYMVGTFISNVRNMKTYTTNREMGETVSEPVLEHTYKNQIDTKWACNVILSFLLASLYVKMWFSLFPSSVGVLVLPLFDRKRLKKSSIFSIELLLLLPLLDDFFHYNLLCRFRLNREPKRFDAVPRSHTFAIAVKS